MKKVALALSGGGFKGAFQVGALQYLQEHWTELQTSAAPLQFGVATGVSVGSLNSYMIAASKFDQLVQLWQQIARNGAQEVYTSDFIDTTYQGNQPKLKLDFAQLARRFFPNLNTGNISLWQLLGLAISKKKREEFFQKLLQIAGQDFQQTFQQFKALADNTPLKNKLEKLVHKQDIQNCIYKCGYVSLDNGEYYSLRHTEFPTDEELVKAILASTAMPVAWPPVKAVTNSEGTQKNLVDGGIKNVSPIGDVLAEINASSDEYLIVIINCNSGTVVPEDYDNKNIAQIALRSLSEIAITEIFNNDIRAFLDKNFLVQQVLEKHPGEVLYDYDADNQKPGKPMRHFDTIIIQPDKNLGDSLSISEALINERLQLGRQKAAEALTAFKTSSGQFRVGIS